MTVFEIISLVLSSIALIVSVLPQIKKWVTKANVKFYPVGLLTLLFNQSGSYVQLNGVIEAEKKAVSIRKMSVEIKRQKDNQTLNLTWSYLISPVNQRLVGNIIQTTELAHPFRVYGDSITTAFIEYTDPFDSFGKTFRNSTSDLYNKANLKPLFENNYSEAVKSFSADDSFITVKQLLSDEFFWKVGKYSIVVTIEYNNSKRAYSYEFSVSESDYNDLIKNIEESLLVPLKTNYQINPFFNQAHVELIEIE